MEPIVMCADLQAQNDLFLQSSIVLEHFRRKIAKSKAVFQEKTRMSQQDYIMVSIASL